MEHKIELEQYLELEMEYERCRIFYELINRIENELNIFKDSRKRYENKNIINRFVLECINEGINISQDCTSVYLFSNPVLESKILLKTKVYYEKMLSEYKEKHINLTPIKVNNITDIYIGAHNQYRRICEEIKVCKNIPENLEFNIVKNNTKNYSQSNDKSYYCLKYKNYIKVISESRYEQLIGNFNLNNHNHNHLPNDSSRNYFIMKLFLRYGIFENSGNQWSIGINLYDYIGKLLSINCELFASPLNFNLSKYCSVFYDTDSKFGSIGSFDNISLDKIVTENITGVIFNPPYMPLLMQNTMERCIDLLKQLKTREIDFNIVSFLPYWKDADYMKRFLESEFVIGYRVMKRGEYLIQEKDSGHIIKGVGFELLVVLMNSTKTRIEELETSFRAVVKYIIDETK